MVDVSRFYFCCYVLTSLVPLLSNFSEITCQSNSESDTLKSSYLRVKWGSFLCLFSHVEKII